MPRTARIALAEYPHHIVQRGHNRQDVFVTDDDRLNYLATLSEFRRELGVKVYAYCLMTNHIHLVINPGRDAANLGLLMQRLAGRHTARINRGGYRTGTLWEGRFKCSLVQSDLYLLACTRYVDLNPVRAMLVRKPEHYRWSSYRARIGLTACDWLDEDPCFQRLGPTRDLRQRRYHEFVDAGISANELGLIRRAAQRNQPTGSKAFVAEIERRTGLCAARHGRGRPGAKE